MLTNREKRSVYLLIIVLVILATGLFFYFRYTDLLLVENQITNTTRQIQKILSTTPAEESLVASVTELQNRITSEITRFYKADEIDLSTFSSLARDLMEKNNLSVIKVRRESNPKSKYVEFELEGSAYNLASFLKAVSTYPKYWTILNLDIDNKQKDGKKMNISLRIIYEIYNSINR